MLNMITNTVHFSDILQLNVKLTTLKTGTVSSTHSTTILNSDNDKFDCEDTGVNKKLRDFNNFN